MGWYEAAWEYYLSMPDDAGVSSLPAEWQRELVALMLVNREVNNGGYLQFLVNHGRDAYEYASRALRVIGGRRMAETIDCCQALVDEYFPSEGRSSDQLRQLLSNEIIGRDGQTVKEAGSLLPESVVARVSELSYEFMDYPDDVRDLAQTHFGPIIEGDRRAEPGAPPDRPRD